MYKADFMKRVFEDARYELTSPYGYRISPITGTRKFHDGEDYGTFRLNVPLYSPVYGTIIASTYSAIMGHYVKIKTPFGIIRMQHMKYRHVAVGQEVCPGTLVGVCGTTGSSTGIHLHIAYSSLTGATMSPDTFIARYAETRPYNGLWPINTVGVGRGTGVDASKWQAFLCWYGPNTTIDGHFGTDSKAKTINFQKLNGLEPDGLAGPATKAVAKTVLRP